MCLPLLLQQLGGGWANSCNAADSVVTSQWSWEAAPSGGYTLSRSPHGIAGWPGSPVFLQKHSLLQGSLNLTPYLCSGNFKPGVYAVSVTGRLPQGNPLETSLPARGSCSLWHWCAAGCWVDACWSWGGAGTWVRGSSEQLYICLQKWLPGAVLATGWGGFVRGLGTFAVSACQP